MPARRIDVEFGLKITEVSAEDLAPILETLARLARSGTVQMSPETRRLLETHATQAALAPAGPGARVGSRETVTEARVIAALTEARGDVRAAAKAVNLAESGLYRFCQRHGIKPAAFRVQPLAGAGTGGLR